MYVLKIIDDRLIDRVLHFLVFKVPFIRTWFANNHVDAFSISLWFNRQGNTDATYGALVNNGDSVEKAGFSLRIIENNNLVGKIRTENGEKSVTVTIPVG